MREYIDGDHKVTEYDNGAVVRELITNPPEPESIPIPEPPKITTNDDIMAALEEQRQADLDRDELQINLLIGQEELKLNLEVAQNV